MKLFADIDISTHVVAELLALGHDISRVDRFLDPRTSDEEITSFVRLQRAVLITRDQDFSDILATTRASTPTIINLRHSRTDFPFLVTLLDHVLRGEWCLTSVGAVQLRAAKARRLDGCAVESSTLSPGSSTR